MSKRPLPILHVDGSLTEYIDKNGILHQIAGLGGYLVVEGKIVKKFHKTLQDKPHLNHHEEYAVLEGMRLVKGLGYQTLRIKTDSMYSVDLFNNRKKTLSKIDKFFFVQFMMLEFGFEWVEIIHHSRTLDDMSHLLSRNYLNHLPKDIVKLHTEHKKKSDYEICGDATQIKEKDLRIFLCKNMAEISPFVEK